VAENKQNGKKIYSIGEIAQIVGMTTRTIRYYEEIGLLNSVKRLEGGKRIYTDDDIRRLKFINRLKVLGLTLNDMKELENVYSVSKSNKAALLKLLDILDKHLQEIENRINSLQRLSVEINDYKKHINKRLQELKE
jgi:DNA-binding transcriptional MerR regulator